jgi:hypothetical protein
LPNIAPGVCRGRRLIAEQFFHSEPGTGKSLYSRILAQACGLPLVVSSVADWFLCGHTPVRTENLNAGVAVMKSAQDGVN